MHAGSYAVGPAARAAARVRNDYNARLSRRKRASPDRLSTLLPFNPFALPRHCDVSVRGLLKSSTLWGLPHYEAILDLTDTSVKTAAKRLNVLIAENGSRS